MMDPAEILATSAALVASREEVKRLKARVEELEAAIKDPLAALAESVGSAVRIYRDAFRMRLMKLPPSGD